MVQFLFYKGHDTTPEGAIGQALNQCGEVLMNNPSLVVQLENLYATGGSWDADIRILALANEDSGHVKKHKGHEHNYEIKNPEHARSGNPNEWRPIGMEHDPQPMAFRFGNAAIAGELPDVPIQEIAVPGYDPAYSSEFELRRLLLELEKVRQKKFETLENDLD